jgi:hypothetical protein
VRKFAGHSPAIVIALAMAYSISVDKLSKLYSAVRLGADNRLVAGW